MYTSPDDARSDLFLSGAVYVFGPLLAGILLNLLPRTLVSALAPALVVVLPLALTVLVPWLLIRYRGERLAAYGVTGLRPADLGLGALLAVPLVAASVLLVATWGSPLRGLTAVYAVNSTLGLVGLLGRLSQWLGLALLGVYMTVKARDAFRQDHLTVREGVERIGRVVVLIAVGAAALLLLAQLARGGAALDAAVQLVVPVALAGSLWLALRALRGPSVTSRQVLLTPTILFAIAPFTLSLDGARFVQGIYLAAVYAGLGLVVGVLVESRRSAWAPVGLAAVTALLTIFAVTAF